VRTHDGETNNFPITIGLPQGSNPKPLSFYFSFGFTYGLHPSASTEMHGFCKRYSSTWRVEGGIKWEVGDEP